MSKVGVILFLLISILGKAQSPTIPEFNFMRMDNSKLFTQNDLVSGKTSLFVFFDVACPHCQEAIKSFNTHYKELKKLAIYLVTLDNKTSATQFLLTYGKNLSKLGTLTLLQDRYNEFIVKFKPVKYPSIFLYSSSRKLLLYSNEPNDISKLLKKIKTVTN